MLPFNKGVVLEGERIVKVIDAGSYWISPRQTLFPVDIRARPFQTTPGELLTADKQAVRIRFSGEYKVADPAAFIRESSDGHGAFYLSLEHEIPLSIAEFDRCDILNAQVSPAVRIKERMEPRAAQLGISLTHLEVSDLVPIGRIEFFEEQ